MFFSDRLPSPAGSTAPVTMGVHFTGLYFVNSPLYTAPADSGGPGKGTDTTVAKGYSKAAKIKPPLLFNHAHTGVNDMQNVVIRQQLHAASSQNT